jgi:hypothetical protein
MLARIQREKGLSYTAGGKKSKLIKSETQKGR